MSSNSQPIIIRFLPNPHHIIIKFSLILIQLLPNSHSIMFHFSSNYYPILPKFSPNYHSILYPFLIQFLPFLSHSHSIHPNPILTLFFPFFINSEKKLSILVENVDRRHTIPQKKAAILIFRFHKFSLKFSEITEMRKNSL